MLRCWWGGIVRDKGQWVRCSFFVGWVLFTPSDDRFLGNQPFETWWMCCWYHKVRTFKILRIKSRVAVITTSGWSHQSSDAKDSTHQQLHTNFVVQILRAVCGCRGGIYPRIPQLAWSFNPFFKLPFLQIYNFHRIDFQKKKWSESKSYILFILLIAGYPPPLELGSFFRWWATDFSHFPTPFCPGLRERPSLPLWWRPTMLQPGQNDVNQVLAIGAKVWWYYIEAPKKWDSGIDRQDVNGEVRSILWGDKHKGEVTTPLQHDFHCQATIPDFAICSSGQLEELD